MAVSEEHVVRMLRISGYSFDEAWSLIAKLKFPAPLEDVVDIFSRLGLSADSLINEMGGSP